jgi:transmembrane sensor
MADRAGPDGIDAELLDRYLAHECSEAEVAIVRRHLMARPDLAAALASFLATLEEDGARPAPPDAAASWARLQGRLRDASDDSLRALAATSEAHRLARAKSHHLFASLPSNRRGSRWRRVMYATLATCIVGAVMLHLEKRTTPPPPSPPPEIFATTNRERAELRLSDGTRIRLAPASRVQVAADYDEAQRTVHLEGEAYFEVKHDANKPFVVYAGAAVTRDLGTDFAVRNYTEDAGVQVVVRTGAVAMSGVGRLGAGDVGRLGSDGSSSVTRGGDVESLLGWLDGRLIFRDAPLNSVIAELRRWHDADVKLADPALGTLPFTGVLTDASFRSSIDLVAATLGLRARRTGARVVFERIGGLTPTPSSPAAAVHRR